MTPQRQLVLDAVRVLQHATPEQVCHRVQQTTPTVNITTIYRALDLLEGLGLVRHTHLGHGAPVYSAQAHEHLHLVCHQLRAGNGAAHGAVGRSDAAVVAGMRVRTGRHPSRAVRDMPQMPCRRRNHECVAAAGHPWCCGRAGGRLAGRGHRLALRRPVRRAAVRRAVGRRGRPVHRGVIAVPGEDRLDWLHALTSQHFTQLGDRPAPRHSCWTRTGTSRTTSWSATQATRCGWTRSAHRTAPLLYYLDQDAVLVEGRAEGRHRRTAPC